MDDEMLQKLFSAAKGESNDIESLLKKLTTSGLLDNPESGTTFLRVAAESNCVNSFKHIALFTKHNRQECVLSDLLDYENLKDFLGKLEDEDDTCEALLRLCEPDGKTVLYLAAEKGKQDLFETLLKLAPKQERLELINMPTRSNSTILHLVAEKGLQDILNLVSNEETFKPVAQPDEEGTQLMPPPFETPKIIQNKKGANPLHLAAQHGHQSCFEKLLQLIPSRERVFYLTKTTKKDKTVLHIAAEKQDRLDFFQSIPDELRVILKEDIAALRPENQQSVILPSVLQPGVLQTVVDAGCHETVEFILGLLKEVDEGLRNSYRCLIHVLAKRDKFDDATCHALVDGLGTYIESTKHVLAPKLRLMKVALHKACYGKFDILKKYLDKVGTEAEKLALLILLKKSARQINKGAYAARFENWLKGLASSTDEKGVKRFCGSAAKLTDDDLLHDLSLLSQNLKTEKDVSQYILRWTDVRGDTLAHIAVATESKDTVETLLDWEASDPYDSVLERPNDDKKTLLQLETSQEIKNLLAKAMANTGRYHKPLVKPPKFLIFFNDKDRNGAEEECENLKQLGRKIQTEPIAIRNPTREKVLNEILKESQNSESCLIVAYLAHGAEHRVQVESAGTEAGRAQETGGGDRRATSPAEVPSHEHCETMDIAEIIETMDNPYMRGKPKVFIVQACQGRGTQAEGRANEPFGVGDEITASTSNLLKESLTSTDNLENLVMNHVRPANFEWPDTLPFGQQKLREHREIEKFALAGLYAACRVNSILQTDFNWQRLQRNSCDSIKLFAQASRRLIRNKANFRRPALDHIPEHFLYLTSTVPPKKSARQLMAKMLLESCRPTGDSRPCCVDMQVLFHETIAAIYRKKVRPQTPMMASTLVKRLCLPLHVEGNQELTTTTDTTDTVNTVDTTDTVDTVDTADTVDTVDTTDTVNTVDTTDTVDTVDTTDTVDAVDTTDTVDTVDTTDTTDTADTTNTVDTTDTADTVDTTDTADTADTVETANTNEIDK